MRNYTYVLNEGFNSYFNKLNESDEELPINYLEDDLRSDVYNALSDIAFKYHQKGADITEDEMDIAIEWFQLHFWEGDDSDFDSMNESYNYNLNTDIYNALGNVMFEYHLKGIDVTEEDVSKALDDFKERFFHSLTDDDYEDMGIEFSNDMHENFTHKSNKSLKESKLNEEFEDYCVTIGFCGMIGVEQEYTIYAEDEDSARIDALNEAEYDLEVENISDNGDGTFDVEVSFCGFIGCEEIFTVDAEDEAEAEEAALELAKDNLDILSIDIDMEESYKPKKNRLKEAANKKIVTIGLYGGDEVPGIYDVSELVKYFKSKGLSVSDVSGNIDYGWEMNITGSPRDIFFAVQNKIPGYDSDSIDEFISEYRIDESLKEDINSKKLDEEFKLTDNILKKILFKMYDDTDPDYYSLKSFYEFCIYELKMTAFDLYKYVGKFILNDLEEIADIIVKTPIINIEEEAEVNKAIKILNKYGINAVKKHEYDDYDEEDIFWIEIKGLLKNKTNESLNESIRFDAVSKIENYLKNNIVENANSAVYITDIDIEKQTIPLEVIPKITIHFEPFDDEIFEDEYEKQVALEKYLGIIGDYIEEYFDIYSMSLADFGNDYATYEIEYNLH